MIWTHHRQDNPRRRYPKTARLALASIDPDIVATSLQETALRPLDSKAPSRQTPKSFYFRDPPQCRVANPTSNPTSIPNKRSTRPFPTKLVRTQRKNGRQKQQTRALEKPLDLWNREAGHILGWLCTTKFDSVLPHRLRVKGNRSKAQKTRLPNGITY